MPSYTQDAVSRPQPRVLRDTPDWDNLLGPSASPTAAFVPIGERASLLRQSERQVPQGNYNISVAPSFPVAVHYTVDGTLLDLQDSYSNTAYPFLADGPHRNQSTPYPPLTAERHLGAEELRPNIQGFESILSAMDVFTACKEIFDTKGNDLDGHCSGPCESLEGQLSKEMSNIRDTATQALQSSEEIIRSHTNFARELDRGHAEISHMPEAGPLFSSPDIFPLSEAIGESTSLLSSSVLGIRDRVHSFAALTQNLSTRNRDAETSRRRKVWNWLHRALERLAKALSAGGKLAPLCGGTAGVVAGVVMEGVSPICAGLAKVCKNRAERTVTSSEDTNLQEFISFLQETLLSMAGEAETKLMDFRPFLLVHQTLYDMQRTGHQAFVSPWEAVQARIDLSEWFSRFDVGGGVLTLAQNSSAAVASPTCF